MYRLRYPHPAAGCEPHVAGAAGGHGSGPKLKGSNLSSPADGAERDRPLPADDDVAPTDYPLPLVAHVQ